MNDDCGCCDGIEAVTPKSVANRPGLSSLAYRVGTHSSFLETMIARLATVKVSRPTGAFDAAGNQILEYYTTLGGLKTHETSDFSIALLDAWATVADVLTFYQERIANEGYLRTATERRSIVELSRLIDYVPKPGVSASVYLAYTLDKNTDTTIPAGARSQSVPGAGEQPQAFETADKLDARYDWNNLKPRSSRPQLIPAQMRDGHRLFLQGIATKLHPGDPLIVRADPREIYRVVQVKPDAAASRTTVLIRSWSDAPALVDTIGKVRLAIDAFDKQVTNDGSPPFLTDIQTTVLGPLEAFIKQSSVQDELEAHVYSTVRQIAAKLVGAAPGAQVDHVIQLWDALAQTLLIDARAASLSDSLKKISSVTAPQGATQEVRDRVAAMVIALNNLKDTIAHLSDNPSKQPASPRDPVNRDRVAALVVALQTAIENIRLETAELDANDKTLQPLLNVLNTLVTNLTDAVRTFPTEAIWSGLDAIRIVYTARDNAIALELAAAGPADPRATADLTAVQDTLDALGTIAPLTDPTLLTARIRDVDDSNLPTGVPASTNQSVVAFVRIVRQALDDFMVSLSFGPIRRDVRTIIARYTDPAGAGLFTGASDPDDPNAFLPDTAIADRVVRSLKGWVSGLSPDQDPASVVSNLELTLSAIRTELLLVEAGGYPRLEPWLSSLTGEIEEAAQRASLASSTISLLAASGKNLKTHENGKPQAPPSSPSPITPDGLLQQLLTSPSVPPSDASRLQRNLANIFASTKSPGRGGDSGPTGVAFSSADVSAQLLVNFDDRLKSSLYPALANVPVSPSSQPTSVKAPRVKAAPFGAAAPLKPVLENGNVVGAEEWPLATVAFELEMPSVPVSVSSAPSIVVTASVIRDGQLDSNQTPFGLGVVPLQLKDTLVLITTTLPGPASPTAVTITSIQFQFTNTGLERPTGQLLDTITVNLAGRGFDVVCGSEPSVSVSQANPLAHVALLGHEVEVTWHAPAITGGSPGVSIKHSIPDAPLSRYWNVLTLDGVFDQIVPESWVVIERADQSGAKALQVRQVAAVATVAEAEFGISGKATRLTLDAAWLDQDDTDLSAFRKTTVYVQTDTLPLAEEPYDADIGGDTVELDDLKDGLKSGRFVIISGERTDIPATGGVFASELTMLRTVSQDFDSDLPGDKLHSYLGLSDPPLAYTYKRSSVTIYGNVIKATHGETRNEVLGSGDASQELQSFSLKQKPLTFVPFASPSGAQSTLVVRVNDVLWSEVTSLSNLDSAAHSYVTLTGDDDVVTAAFGDGTRGARLPSGRENVRTSYRTGIGKAGNVGAGQISLLVTRPLGVKSITNPLSASGGADRESLDQARENAPLSVTALDRLVSVQDYEDFARNFAGIAKASAQRFVNRGFEFVHLTIAGADDMPFDPSSDLSKVFLRSLRQSGDQFQSVSVASRDLVTVILSAEVRVEAGYLWEVVSPLVRQALLAAFGFDRRVLGQCLWLSEVYQAIQAVEGVDYVSVKHFGGLPERGSDGRIITFEEIRALIDGRPAQTDPASGVTSPAVVGIAIAPPREWIPARLATMDEAGNVRPAQIVLMTPDVPDTIILTEIPS
jgi:predicted phage baseplate assembly protein